MGLGLGFLSKWAGEIGLGERHPNYDIQRPFRQLGAFVPHRTLQQLMSFLQGRSWYVRISSHSYISKDL